MTVPTPSVQRSVERARVVLVHGLWMRGFQLCILKRRLERRALSVATFSYPSLTGSMDEHARRLIDFVDALSAREVHFIGHSLGGLVIMRALQMRHDLPPGRVVLLGTPLQGSKAAQSVARSVPFGKILLGAAVREECVDWSPREWAGDREIGIVAGSTGLGLGRLSARLESAHDGTVLVEETRLTGAKDHIVLGVSHTGMLFSAAVATQAARFLETGAFNR